MLTEEILTGIARQAQFRKDHHLDALTFGLGNQTLYLLHIVDHVNAQYPGYKIKDLYILMIKNKATYQLMIGKKKGFFVKKWRQLKLLNYETDGKFIDAIEY